VASLQAIHLCCTENCGCFFTRGTHSRPTAWHAASGRGPPGVWVLLRRPPLATLPTPHIRPTADWFV